ECAQLARVGRPFQEYVMRNRGSPLHDRVQLWQGRDPGFHRDVWCACQTLPEYGHQLDGQTGMCFVEHALPVPLDEGVEPAHPVRRVVGAGAGDWDQADFISKKSKSNFAVLVDEKAFVKPAALFKITPAD